MHIFCRSSAINSKLNNMPSEADPGVYSIGAVSRMLNIPAPTLRAWQARYSLIAPARSSGSQRLYSRTQLEHLRFIKAQIDSGVTAADAHRLLAEQLKGEQVTPPKAVAPNGGEPLVLIADRDPYAADIVGHFLRAEGYAVETAVDATDARRMYAERRPAVVIVDLLISGGEGFRLVAEFAQGQKTPVIAVASMDARVDAEKAGAAAFIQKPIQPRTLIATLTQLLGTKAVAYE